MSTALTLFDQPNAIVPAHIGSFFDEESNVQERNTTPSLSVTGKVWTINLNGESTKLTKTDSDGDEIPISVMRVVILDYGKRRGRSYYEGNYDPNNTAKPLCWSEDGLTPSAQVAEPQASKCDKCPMAVKGSRISDNGKATTACGQHRILVVVPANDLEFPALRFKIAVTSDYDGQSPDLTAANWHAFSNLLDLMRSKGVQHTAAMVVKMKFDPNAAYPKVIFSPDRWLSQDELATIKPRLKSDEVLKLVAGVMTTETDKPDAPAPKAVPAPAPAKAPVKATALDEDEDEAPVVKKPAKAAKPAPVEDDEDEAPVVKKPAKAAKPAVVEDDEDEAPVVKKPAKAAKAAAPAPAKVATEVPDDVESLLADWGDD